MNRWGISRRENLQSKIVPVWPNQTDKPTKPYWSDGGQILIANTSSLFNCEHSSKIIGFEEGEQVSKAQRSAQGMLVNLRIKRTMSIKKS